MPNPIDRRLTQEPRLRIHVPQQDDEIELLKNQAKKILTRAGFANIELKFDNKNSSFQLRAAVPKDMLQEDFDSAIFTAACEISETAKQPISINYNFDDITPIK